MSRNAFTLIELLAVTAILAAIQFPVFAQAKADANDAFGDSKYLTQDAGPGRKRTLDYVAGIPEWNGKQ